MKHKNNKKPSRPLKNKNYKSDLKMEITSEVQQSMSKEVHRGEQGCPIKFEPNQTCLTWAHPSEKPLDLSGVSIDDGWNVSKPDLI